MAGEAFGFPRLYKNRLKDPDKDWRERGGGAKSITPIANHRRREAIVGADPRIGAGPGGGEVSPTPSGLAPFGKDNDDESLSIFSDQQVPAKKIDVDIPKERERVVGNKIPSKLTMQQTGVSRCNLPPSNMALPATSNILRQREIYQPERLFLFSNLLIQ
ncbi:uncharacterized protein BO95DRAFT_436984 [Aspergillus brunneoviolaceus CBS 621.78]|uniref:Uncharacterized protein n=1 Tax=Aspergillus brunneoviolaceus CBS 621.78 TaxID=1450534 RepID=A0ACD1FT09_9EURO|nr:hypothetical protein BO95DRAFT_436984 [Aspergillus brunneoviolaceus CBS 621.78]RAH40118.1 hypothetical protein BO95DRAFT_436984 [Aspergillus brunneoviolaceus CBS 621.78]